MYFATHAIARAAGDVTKIFQEHSLGSLHSRTLFFKVFGSVYHRIIAVSNDTAQAVIKAGAAAEKVCVIGNPLDTRQFAPKLPRDEARAALGLRPGRFLVGSACRMAPEKDLSLFLHAARAIHAQRGDVGFALAGAGEQEGHLRRLTTRLGLDEVVAFLGVRNDMPVVWRALDVYLFTSLREPFGRTLLESHCSETPVVGCLPVSGGAEEILRESPGAIAVEGRTPDALADATLRLLDSADRRQQLGSRGREWVIDRFDARDWIKRIEALYRVSLSDGKGTRNMEKASLTQSY
jgi:glycosyltransferase involved in cell wall biosynthesis